MASSKLRLILQKHRISLIELAAQAGLPMAYLEKIEDGTIKPTEGDKERIKKALKRIEASAKQPDDTPDDY